MAIDRSEAIALFGLAAALGIAVVVASRAYRPVPPPRVEQPPDVALISVHVAGEVLWPGLYVLKAGSRLQDAIFAAHGPTLIADLRKVNLAAPLRDGDRVVIPRIAQPPYPFEQVRRVAHPPPGRRTAPGEALAGDAARAGEPVGTVNVNTATAAELERLPGVGSVLARRIVEHREAKGLFRRLEDLQEVRGIGPKLFRRLEPYLRLE
ncbi:MAG: ComEA family DNA-binding protein [Armatimonadota bacterium]|nr:ComEA family DNA-binding protein [Armatimonadota bacterium]